jgi:hypothetical protein
MDLRNIQSPDDLDEWLGDKPGEWAVGIALRAAIRVLPITDFLMKEWLRVHAISLLRAIIIVWSGDHFSYFTRRDASEKLSKALSAGRKKYAVYAANAAASIYRVLHLTEELESIPVGLKISSAINPAYACADAALGSANADLLQDSVIADCRWLENQKVDQESKLKFLRSPLWPATRLPLALRKNWHSFTKKFLEIDPNFDVWIDWYERRIRGEIASFDIPGDKRRVEDKKILRRLAEATDEDFWGKGHEYVNATLKGWLDEARARSAPPTIVADASSILEFTLSAHAEVGPLPSPPQDTRAIAYGVNDQGKLDRLPNSDQVHLRDVPDQRRAYNDLRQAAAELLAEGQRLGHRLTRALDRFLQSLPGHFDDAEAYLVWRDANALRRLHRAHREAAKSPEPDEARLEPVIAEELGGLLDLYNNFAFADDGLRTKDEARISPQERASAVAEAAVSRPLFEAIMAAPDIATAEARDDIAADAEDADLPGGDPYAAQVLDQSNRTKRNWIAGLLGGAREALSNPKLLGKRATIGTATGVGTAVGAVATKSVLGLSYAPLIEFIATNGPALQSYVAVAFTSFPHLPGLIEAISALWNDRKPPA